MIAFDELYELKSELEAILTNNTIDELLNHQRTTALSDLYIKVQMLVASEAKNSVRVQRDFVWKMCVNMTGTRGGKPLFEMFQERSGITELPVTISFSSDAYRLKDTFSQDSLPVFAHD